MKISRRAVVATAGLSLVAGLCACSGGPGDSGGNGDSTTINFSWWGSGAITDSFSDAVDKFREQNPDITVNTSFLEWEAYWQKRNTEAAGGGLPDVMLFDISYLRQYADRSLLTDLVDLESDGLDTSTVDDGVLTTGQVDGVQYGVPIAVNGWSLLYNPAELEAASLELPEAPYTWDEYDDFLRQAAAAGIDNQLGGPDYAYRMQTFELQLRQEGTYLISPDGTLGFDEDRLAEFWQHAAELRDESLLIPQDRVEQMQPKFPISSGEAMTEFLWSNQSTQMAVELGTPLIGVALPPSDTDVSGVSAKASMLLSVSSTASNSEAAARLVNFLLNDPAAVNASWISGVPTSSAQMEGYELDEQQQIIQDYQDQIAEVGVEAPPAPISGYGTLEANFLRLGQELAYGDLSVDDAVSQWFEEADTVLNQQS